MGFFSYLIKKHYVHKLKAEYGGVYEYLKERLHYSKDHFNKMVKMGEKFIRIKQNVDFKNYHELTSFESYAYCVNSLKLPLKYTQIMEMLFLPDDQIIHAVKNQKIIPSMTAKEIRNYVSSLKNNGISDKFETVPLNVPVLRLGDTGYTVKRVQQILFMENYNIEVSGIFDQMTQEAIKKYQFDNGLNLNGICDSLTWKHLIL